MTTSGHAEPATMPLAEGRTILVPLDGSEEAANAWPVARAFAALHGARLRALYLSSQTVELRKLPHRLGLDECELRGAIIDQARGSPGSATVRGSREHPSGLVVVSTHFEASRGGLVLGHFLRRLLTGAACPVVLVPRAFDARSFRIEKVLLPQDGTPSMAFAIAPALDLAVRASAMLLVLHVAAAEPPRRIEPGSLRVPRYLDQLHHEWPAWTYEFLDRIERLGRAPAGLRLRMHLACGDPGENIVAFAEEHAVSLIVLAWRGRLDLDRARTLRTVVCNARCPVLVFRSG